MSSPAPRTGCEAPTTGPAGRALLPCCAWWWLSLLLWSLGLPRRLARKRRSAHAPSASSSRRSSDSPTASPTVEALLPRSAPGGVVAVAPAPALALAGGCPLVVVGVVAVVGLTTTVDEWDTVVHTVEVDAEDEEEEEADDLGTMRNSGDRARRPPAALESSRRYVQLVVVVVVVPAVQLRGPYSVSVHSKDHSSVPGTEKSRSSEGPQGGEGGLMG